MDQDLWPEPAEQHFQGVPFTLAYSEQGGQVHVHLTLPGQQSETLNVIDVRRHPLLLTRPQMLARQLHGNLLHEVHLGLGRALRMLSDARDGWTLQLAPGHGTDPYERWALRQLHLQRQPYTLGPHFCDCNDVSHRVQYSGRATTLRSQAEEDLIRKVANQFSYAALFRSPLTAGLNEQDQDRAALHLLLDLEAALRRAAPEYAAPQPTVLISVCPDMDTLIHDMAEHDAELHRLLDAARAELRAHAAKLTETLLGRHVAPLLQAQD